MITQREIQLRVIRGYGRSRLSNGDEQTKVVFDLVGLAHKDGIPEDVLREAVADLRKEGLIT